MVPEVGYFSKFYAFNEDKDSSLDCGLLGYNAVYT